MKAWRVIALKELRDAGRDRRALMALLLFPLLGPLMIYFLLNSILDIGEEVRDIELPVLGLGNAPDLADYLRQNGLALTPVEPPEGVERVACWEEATEAFPAAFTVSSAWLVVGPEGGLSSDDAALLSSHGYRLVSLGGSVLRVETAGPVAVALAQDRLMRLR